MVAPFDQAQQLVFAFIELVVSQRGHDVAAGAGWLVRKALIVCQEVQEHNRRFVLQ